METPEYIEGKIKSDQVSQYLALVWTVHGQICFSIVSSDYLTKGSEHIRLVFCLQNYNIFLTPQGDFFLPLHLYTSKNETTDHEYHP